MFAARKANNVPLFSEENIATRWLKRNVLDNHRIFQQTSNNESQTGISLASNKPLTAVEKYRRANRLMQRISELASEGSRRQFQQRITVLQDLMKIWENNSEALVTAIDAQSLPEENEEMPFDQSITGEER